MVLNMKSVVLEKPVVAQLVSNLTTYLTRRPVTVFTTVAPSYYFFKIRLKLFFPSALRSPKLISIPGFRLKSCGVLSLPCVLHIPQISLFLVTPRFGSFTLAAENSGIRSEGNSIWLHSDKRHGGLDYPRRTHAAEAATSSWR
jgi:hypothetical protein